MLANVEDFECILGLSTVLGEVMSGHGQAQHPPHLPETPNVLTRIPWRHVS